LAAAAFNASGVDNSTLGITQEAQKAKADTIALSYGESI
jgi:hypothetical protein